MSSGWITCPALGDRKGDAVRRLCFRYVLSESGIEKEIHRDPLGRVVADTQTTFWTPLGFRGGRFDNAKGPNDLQLAFLSGVDIHELSVVIMPHARPYDTVVGRYMSFGPTQMGRVRFADIVASVDPFALEPAETAPLIPTGRDQ